MNTRKNGLLDRRFRCNRPEVKRQRELARRLYIQQLIAVALLGFLAGTILTKTLWDASRPQKLLDPRGTGIIKVQEVKAAEPKFCRDVIACIRDVGTEMGETNSHIMQMIRIAKAESGLRADAMGKNKNGTFDIGVFQINDVHGKRISRADRLDYEKNIRFAYQLHQEQKHSFRAWVAFTSGKAK